MDICIELSDEMQKKWCRFKRFWKGIIKIDTRRFYKKELFTQLGYEPLRIDILNDMDSVPFEQAWKNKREVEYEGIKINFVGYAELLKLK